MAVSKGIQTTEFALTVVVNVAGIIGSFSGLIPPAWAILVVAVTNSIYGILRAVIKINDPSYVPPSLPVATTSTTSTTTIAG